MALVVNPDIEIKAIIFDLGGVLFTDGTKQFINYLIEEYGINAEQASKVLNGDLGSKYRVGKINREEFWQQAKEEWSVQASIDDLEMHWITGYHLDEQVKQIILDLKQKYKIYYLSDNVKERIDYIDAKYHFIKLFDGGVFSHEAGVRKPDVEIYRHAIKLTNLYPNELIFIDDKETALQPAKSLGMSVLHFTGPEKLIDDLKSLRLI